MKSINYNMENLELYLVSKSNRKSKDKIKLNKFGKQIN